MKGQRLFSRRGGTAWSALAIVTFASAPLCAQSLPLPTADPLAMPVQDDPILALAEQSVPVDTFRAAIADAVRRNPSLGESIAQRQEVEAQRNEARARQYPTVDVSLSHFEVLSRAFSNDPQNILERQRPQFRTDGSLRISQPLIDFNASRDRILAANARLRAATAGVEDTSNQIALRTVAAWYEVYSYRNLVRLGEAFVVSQGELRDKVGERVRQGVSAQGDVAQVDSYIAASKSQLADFRRSLASAEAQYAQLVGAPAPASLARAPVPVLPKTAITDLTNLPAIRAARAQSDAARQDVRAVTADQLPGVSVSVDAGRYGILQNGRDYDIRGTVSMNWRLFGGAKQRVDQAQARANGAEARFQRAREEATRDAEIAKSDIAALEAAKDALAENYVASRRSRDVLAERFRVSRGTLFDLLGAQSNYFGVAARYLQTVTELDTARYILLARTGKLLESLGIDATRLDPR